MNARSQTAQDLANARPVAFDASLADAWRGTHRALAEHILFIRQHQKTVAEKDALLRPGVPKHRPAYVEYARNLLAIRLPQYLDAVRRVTEYEQRMTLIGMPFAKSSDAWDAA